MEMEGLKKWLPARTTGYTQLEKAVVRFNFYGKAATSAAIEWSRSSAIYA